MYYPADVLRLVSSSRSASGGGSPHWRSVTSTGRHLALTAIEWEQVGVWDLATGRPLAHPVTGAPAHLETGTDVTALAVISVTGWQVAVSATWWDSVRIWDLATGAALDIQFRNSACTTAIAAADVYGTPAVVAGGRDGAVRIWNLATGASIADSLTCHLSEITAVTVAHVDAGLVVVSASDDADVRVTELPPPPHT